LGELLEGFKKPLQEANVLSEQQMNVCFNGFAEIQALHARVRALGSRSTRVQ